MTNAWVVRCFGHSNFPLAPGSHPHTMIPCFMLWWTSSCMPCPLPNLIRIGFRCWILIGYVKSFVFTCFGFLLFWKRAAAAVCVFHPSDQNTLDGKKLIIHQIKQKLLYVKIPVKYEVNKIIQFLASPKRHLRCRFAAIIEEEGLK